MKTHLIAGTCEIADVNGFLHVLNDIAAGYGITVQAIDASKTAGSEHIISATEKAIRASQRNDRISDNLGMEILLYASGNRQIKKALSMGVRNGSNKIVLVAVGDEIPDGAIRELENLVLAADVTGYTREKRAAITTFFGITETEIAAVGEEKIPQLVLERVALMGLWK
ncbi:MAG: KEOPS complex subunit Cgi121 [Euryarchaeota archaeon]|nr:KEOPS complex subunit Cgi121 [Euryarchaeota archaeon]